MLEGWRGMGLHRRTGTLALALLLVVAGAAWGLAPYAAAAPSGTEAVATVAEASGQATEAPAAEPAEPVEPTASQKLVDRFLKAGALKGTQVGVSVVEVPSGRSVAEHRAADKAFLASGTKLLTTAAALLLLAPDTSWTTSLRAQAAKGVVEGPVILVGDGDPKLMPGHLDVLANDAVGKGVSEIRGGILVDARAFDGAILPPGYDIKETDDAYRAAIGTAGVHWGAVEVKVRPGGAPGDPVRVSWYPRGDYVVVDNKAVTGKGKRGGLHISTSAEPDGRTRVRLEGSLGQRSTAVTVRKRVADPDVAAGWVLHRAFTRRGLRVEGGVRVQRSGAVPDAPEVATHPSASLHETIADVNTWSNNYMAETLLKQLGRPLARSGGGAGRGGTWAAATRSAMGALSSKLGLEAADLELVNGSGLYMASKATPRAMTALLAGMAGKTSLAEPFERSLAVAGESGTLKGRLKGKATKGKVRAKTGTLDEVVSLAGYVSTKAGRRLAFSVQVNGTAPKKTKAVRGQIDGLVTKLASLEE